MNSEYIATEIRECLQCETAVPGHVYGLKEPGIYGWTCPICESSYEPGQLNHIRTIEVGDQ